MAKEKKKKNKKWIVLFFIAVFILFTIIYIVPSVSDVFNTTYVAEYGGIQVTDEVSCYIVRNEIVYFANRSGTIQYYLEEGTKVRKSTKILDIATGSAEYEETKYTDILDRIQGQGITPELYVSHCNGLVSYYIDGYEAMITPDTMETLSKDEVTKLDMGLENVTRKTTLANEPLFKIVDNNVWYAVCWVDDEDIIKYKKGGTVTLQLPLGDVKGTTFDIKDDNGEWMIILKFNRYYSDLPRIRKVDANVITEDYKGLIIPNRCISSKDGKYGVYVKDVGGDFVFRPVQAITSDGEYSLVRNSYFYEDSADGAVRVKTIDVYDEILKSGKP